MFLGAFVAWWSHGHISVKIIPSMVNFVRKYPWSRRNIPWLKKLKPPPLLGHAWSRGRMFLMSDSHVVPMCLTICPKNSHSVSVFNYLSKRTPMVTMWLTLCPKELPPTHICLSAIFFDHDGVFPGRMKFYFLEPNPPREN